VFQNSTETEFSIQIFGIQLHYLFVVGFSDVNVMSFTVAVIFAIE